MAPPLLWAWPLLALAVGGAVGGACTGKRWSLTGSGALSDGAGNYSVMGDCIWVLHAPPGQRVLLTLMEVETECGFDFLFVFDGPASRGRLLAALSGNAPPPPLLE
ncbi:multiple epidermal growth factor-like domains protein 8, partial [Gallus gallus]|uniref:multiple epidermal growth factor-like domains protein 8 n=1 Tax=Gallus gallus TaxID=9031 RepID=UPI001AE98805